MSPFDFVNNILYKKDINLLDSETIKDYNSFLINRSLSYHEDCIFFVNEMNKYSNLIYRRMQNDYLLNTIRSNKRSFKKMVKFEKSIDIDNIRKYYKISYEKAKDYYRLLDDNQIKKINEELYTGGIEK